MFPALFVNHGGGPLPLLGRQPEIASHLKDVVQKFIPDRPKAIVVISAHWESDPIKITSSPAPSMLFDYYGFPKESYDFKYPAMGDTKLAESIHEKLKVEGIESELDNERGLDHGVFVPLMLMYPKADIPVVCVSLHSSLDPASHMKLGKALKPLREDGALILGSGYTFHNMQAFFNPSKETHGASTQFNEWLKKVIVEDGNLQKLNEWESAPGARLSHPREEHLMPLLVVAGAAEDGAEQKAQVIYDNNPGNHAVTGYLFA